MKIKKGVDLCKYGFSKTLKAPDISNYDMDIDEEAYQYYDACREFSSQDEIMEHYEYYYNIGQGRRGQSYYILVNSDNELLIWASDADGDGSPVLFPDILLILFRDGVIEY